MKRKLKRISSLCLVVVVLCCAMLPLAAFAADSVTVTMTDKIINVDAGSQHSMTPLGENGYGYLMSTGVQYQLPFAESVEFKAGEYYAFDYRAILSKASGGTDNIRVVAKLSLVSTAGLHVSQEIDLSTSYDVPTVEWYCGSDFTCDGVYLICTSSEESEVMLSMQPSMYITQPESKVGSLSSVVSFIVGLFTDMSGKLLNTPLFLIGISIFVIGGIIAIVKRIL